MIRPPEPPPEGVLIESARTKAKLSVREAARRAGFSEGWWRQVVKGYQSLSGGAYGLVRDVPADTVASMARVVGITPEQLETEGQRPDAADIMREAGRQPSPAEPADPADDLADVRLLLEGIDRAGIPIRPYFDRIMKTVREFPPGVLIPGVVLFGDARYQDKWDEMIGREYAPGRVYTPSRMALVIATQQYRDQREGRQDGAATGLRSAVT